MTSSEPDRSSGDLHVLIVGGGILGLAHAVMARRSGFRVTLVERDIESRGASVRNFGMVWPIGQPGGPALEQAMRSRRLWLEIAERAGLWHRAVGSLHLAHAEDEWQVIREFCDRATMPGLELLTPTAVRALSPAVRTDRLLGGLFSPNEINFDPREAIAGLRAYLARDPAVELVFGIGVRSLRPQSARLADGRELPFDRAVVCPGAELRFLYPELSSRANLMLCRLQMFSLAPPHATFELGPMLAAGLTLLHYTSFADCPSLPALRERMMRTHAPWLARGIHVMVSQGADGRLIVGDSHEYGQSFSPGSDPAIESLILAGLDTMFVAEPLTIQRRWSGVYAMRRDGSGVLRAQPEEGIEVITGVGGSGMTRAFAIAEATIEGMSI